MDELLDFVSEISRVPICRIKGRKRYGQQVSQAKMLFCWIAWNSLRIRHRDIARFLECPRENVYYLIAVAQRNLEYDKELRGLVESGKWKMENGKWKMENGKWKMENGKWKMESGNVALVTKS